MIGNHNTQVPYWIQRFKSWKTGELLQPRIPPLLSDLLQETDSMLPRSQQRVSFTFPDEFWSEDQIANVSPDRIKITRLID